MKSSQEDVQAAKEAVAIAEEALHAAKEEEASFEMKVGQLKVVWEDAKSELDEIEKKLKTCSHDLSAFAKERATLIQKAETAEIEAKKISIKIAKAEKFLRSMMNKYSWIETEKDAFGLRGGDYDFVETNPEEMSKHLKDLQTEQTSLVSSCFLFFFFSR